MPAHSDSTPTAATTKTVEKVLGALRAHPGATSAQVADAAGVGGSTAAKALSSLASHGQVSRTPGIRAGGKRAPDQWHAAQPPDQPAAEPATQASVEPAEQPPVEKALAGDKKGKAARPKPAAKAGSTGAGRTRDDTANAGRASSRVRCGARSSSTWPITRRPRTPPPL